MFLVDTSSGMSKLGHASRQAVFDLIWSGLDGHMRPGDTYGVWTFNETVEKSRLPIQTWHTNSVPLGSVAGRFLRDQPYENRSHPEIAIATLKPTVQMVKDLIVFLISDGQTPIGGTPFDDAINSAYEERARAARKAKQPLITMLVARGGLWVRWSITLPGEKIEMPERAYKPELVLAPTNAPPPTVRSNVTRAPVAPIIITRSKPSEPPPESTPTVPSNRPAITPPTKAPTEVVAVTPGAGPATSPPSSSETNPPAAGSNLVAAPASLPGQTAAPQGVLPPQDSALAGTSVEAPASNTSTLTTSLLAAASSEHAVPAPGLLAPVTVAAREPSPQTNADWVTSDGMLAVTPPPAAAPSRFHPLLMLAIGVVLLLGALALTVLFLRRLRDEPQRSYISQSIDHTPRGPGRH